MIKLNPPPSNRLPPFPPPNTRHPHSPPWPPSSSPSSSHKKCPNLLFVPSAKCTVSSPITYAYTSLLTSSGNMAKNKLWPCPSVRASTSSSGSERSESLDCLLRTAAMVPPLDDNDDDDARSLNRMRDLLFCGAPSCAGMSWGTQRTPGRSCRSRAFIAPWYLSGMCVWMGLKRRLGEGGGM